MRSHALVIAIIILVSFVAVTLVGIAIFIVIKKRIKKSKPKRNIVKNANKSEYKPVKSNA